MAIDFAALAARLLQQSRSYLAEWFPQGKLHGHEFKVGNLAGDPGESLSINVNTGRWADFAEGGSSGGDLISLYAAMHGLDQGEAARRLDGDGSIATKVPAAPPAKDKKREEWTPIIPVPSDAPDAPNEYYRRTSGDEWMKLKYVASWAYSDKDGALLGYAVRFEWYEGSVVKKDIVPQVFAQSSSGKRQWRWRSFPEPRPLYNLKELYERPAAPVIIVEGEKKVEALRTLAPQYVGIAWPGGANSWRKAQWKHLQGRNVLLWPDADRKTVKDERDAAKFGVAVGALIPRDHQPGMRAMWEIGHHLLSMCPTVKVIIPDDESLDDGWDAADAVAEGWDWQRFKAWALPRVITLHEGGSNGTGRDATEGGEPGGQRGCGKDEQDGRAHGAEIRTGAGVADKGDAASSRQDNEADAPANKRSEAGHGGAQPGVIEQRGRDGQGGGGASQTRTGARPDAGVHERDGVQPRSELSPKGNGDGSGSQGAQGPQAPLSQIARWLAWGIERSGNGAPIMSLNNAVRVMEADPALRGLVWFDEFLQRFLTGDPTREWTDADDINLTLYMQREVGLSKISREMVCQAVVAIAMRDRRNCVRDWLSGLKWDETSRIDGFMSAVFGAEDSEYVRAVSRNFWLSMVARVFEPGCKVDNMIVLEGAQGLYKSTVLQIIASPQWFAEQHESATNPKAFAEVLQGKLLIEISEMDSFSRAESTTVKKIVSNQSDRFRASYARHAADHPRQGVMVGTTNKDDWNRDETGARRQWPVRCGKMADAAYVRRWREQLFAEAVALYRRCEPGCEPEARIERNCAWWLVPEREAKIEQRKRYDADPWLGPISHWLVGREDATVNEIAFSCLKIELRDLDRSRQMRIAACLRALGWINGGNKRRAGSVVKVWEPSGDVYGEREDAAKVATKDATVDDDIPFQ